jgi:hypothetical protein
LRKALLPERASWLPDLEAELFSFPGSRHDPRVAAFLIAYVGNGLVDAAVTATLEKSATVVVVVYGFRGKETGGRPGECARINQLERVGEKHRVIEGRAPSHYVASARRTALVNANWSLHVTQTLLDSRG